MAAPDLVDPPGRARRIVVGVLIGVGVGVLVYLAADRLIQIEPPKFHVSPRESGRDTFVSWLSLLSGVLGLFVALVVQQRLAENKQQSERIPRARIH